MDEFGIHCKFWVRRKGSCMATMCQEEGAPLAGTWEGMGRVMFTWGCQGCGRIATFRGGVRVVGGRRGWGGVGLQYFSWFSGSRVFHQPKPTFCKTGNWFLVWYFGLWAKMGPTNPLLTSLDLIPQHWTPIFNLKFGVNFPFSLFQHANINVFYVPNLRLTNEVHWTLSSVCSFFFFSFQLIYMNVYRASSLSQKLMW